MATGEILAIVGDNSSPLEASTDAAHPSINPLKNTESLDELDPIENLAADAPPLPAPGHRSLRQKAEHIWYGLPTAAKTTLILAIVGSFLLIAYSIIAVSLRSYDEEAHVATVIIVISIFILYAAFDAVIYENTLQLIISIILTSLMLARVLWFISTRPTTTTLLPLKVIFGAVISLVLVAFILAALLSCRQFGWRLYSRLGIDYRQKGAEKLQKLAFVAHAFNALVKLDSIFLITITALGIDVSIEHRETPSGVILGITIANFFLDAAITVWGVMTASTAAVALQHRRLLVFDCIAPLSFMGPIALIVIYSQTEVDVANAWASLLIGCLVFLLTRICLWWVLHAVVRNTAKMGFVAGRVVVRASTKGLTSNSAAVDPLLDPLYEGAWLGKPAPRNPRKIRFFQLSQDGSTLRWGWKKFVRLYYVQEVLSSPEALTLTLTFVLDPELTVLFPNEVVLEQWRRGIEHAMMLLMRPDGGNGVLGSNSLHSDSMEKRRGGADGAASTAAVPGVSASAANVDSQLEEGMLRVFGMNIRRMGNKSSSKPISQQQTLPPPAAAQLAAGGAATRRRGTIEASSNELECSTPPIISRSHSIGAPDGPSTSTPPLTSAASAASAGQLQKRQRMAAFLAAAAAATVGRLHSPKDGKIQSFSTPSSRATPAGVAKATSPGAGRVFLPWLRPTPSPAVLGDDDDDEDRVGLGTTEEGGLRKKRRRGALVSVGTQTDDLEIELSSSSVDQAGGPRDAVLQSNTAPLTNATITSDEENAFLASGYADLMASAAAAAAAAASAGGSGSGGGGFGTHSISSAFGFDGRTSSGTPNALPPLQPLDTPHPYNTTTTTATHTSTPTTATALTVSIPEDSGVNFGGGFRSSTTSPSNNNNIHYLSNSNNMIATSSMTPGTPAGALSPTASTSILTPTPMAGSGPLAISVDVIDYEDLAMGKLLGAGSEGAVYAAWYLETPVAVKRFNRVDDSLHEVAMYLGVGSHDNVVALRALCQHESAMYLVLEYCPRGTLDAMLHHSAPQQWDPARLVPLVRSIARGMHHLHSRGIVHRDLKPANIFIGHGQTMKVGDFGMARYVGTSSSAMSPSSPLGSPGRGGAVAGLVRLSPGVIGTTQYAAPELINEDLRPQTDSDAEWAMKVDVWSFGVTLWEIMERKRPFEGATSVAVEAMWLNNPYQARLPPVKVPESVDAAGKRVIRGLSDLIEDCTRVDPMARPSFGAVLRRLRTLSSASG